MWFIDARRDAYGVEPIGNMPPAKLKPAYHRQQEQSAVAAWLKQTGLRRTRGGSPEKFDAIMSPVSLYYLLANRHSGRWQSKCRFSTSRSDRELLYVHILLWERDIDAVGIKMHLDLFQQECSHVPIVRRVYPRAYGDIDAAGT